MWSNHTLEDNLTGIKHLF
uniref:Uncharacterized protein n=1 Tax=Arundo donax TaxID=35708 RepID=A0A0A9B2V4_ARUDO